MAICFTFKVRHHSNVLEKPLNTGTAFVTRLALNKSPVAVLTFSDMASDAQKPMAHAAMRSDTHPVFIDILLPGEMKHYRLNT